MLTIKKQGNFLYNVSLQKPLELLQRGHAQKFKKELKRLMTEHRVVNFNLDFVDEFTDDGYKMLGEILKMAEKKNCEVNLIVDGDNINTKINSQS